LQTALRKWPLEALEPLDLDQFWHYFQIHLRDAIFLESCAQDRCIVGATDGDHHRRLVGRAEIVRDRNRVGQCDRVAFAQLFQIQRAGVKSPCTSFGDGESGLESISIQILRQ